MDSNYKTDHEVFVSNLNGTSPREVLLASSITELSMMAVRAISFQVADQSSYWWFHSLVQSFLISVPSILAVTVLNEHLFLLAFTLLALGSAGVLVRRRIYKNKDIALSKRSENHRIAFISEFRSHLLLDTLISILAVDFPAYPRRFAKTETYGWGFMDIGVGVFVVAAGLVAYETRPSTKVEQWKNLRKTIISSVALVLLGLLRVVVTRQVNYHEHVTEYGMHWNFFLTLAGTRIFCSWLLIFVPVQFSVHFSIFLISLYQFALSNMGLSEFIFRKDRRNIFEANKEGVCSLIGYISCYMAAVHMGRIIANNKENKVKLAVYLFLGGIGFYFSMHLSCLYIQPVSRRIFNISFFLWVISISCFKLFGHLAIDSVLGERTQCAVILAINKNGLWFFLAGNILTGIVNLSVKTLSTSTSETVTILVTYVFISSAIIIAVQRYSAQSKRKKDT